MRGKDLWHLLTPSLVWLVRQKTPNHHVWCCLPHFCPWAAAQFLGSKENPEALPTSCIRYICYLNGVLLLIFKLTIQHSRQLPAQWLSRETPCWYLSGPEGRSARTWAFPHQMHAPASGHCRTKPETAPKTRIQTVRTWWNKERNSLPMQPSDYRMLF